MAGGITASDDAPAWHKAVGISLAVSSSLFIGASFVLKKKGLLDTMKETPGAGHAYLKSPMWWVGMILMLGGEVFNVAAYAFSPASLVTPLGAMSVVISAVLSSIFLKERLSFSAKIGCLQCVIGSIIIVLFSPESSHSNTIPEFVKNIVNPVFLTYSGVMIAFLVVLMAILDPKYGDKWPLVDITICSTVGSYLVVSMQGVGSAIVYSVSHPENSQMGQWPLYVMLVFVIICGVVQIHYLNKALNLFSTAVVTPIYYVCFTTMTLITSAVLFREYSFEDVRAMITTILGFAVIVAGVLLL
ncbi:magnesium transporter, partial [Cladochytrium replicatum]